LLLPPLQVGGGNVLVRVCLFVSRITLKKFGWDIHEIWEVSSLSSTLEFVKLQRDPEHSRYFVIFIDSTVVNWYENE